MALALLDCPTGLAGNMLLAALLDLGVPEAVVHAPLAALGLGEVYGLEISERRSGTENSTPSRPPRPAIASTHQYCDQKSCQ